MGSCRETFALCAQKLRAVTWQFVSVILFSSRKNSSIFRWEARETITKNNVTLRKWTCQPVLLQSVSPFWSFLSLDRHASACLVRRQRNANDEWTQWGEDFRRLVLHGQVQGTSLYRIWSFPFSPQVSPEHYVELLKSAQPTMAQCPVDVDVFTCEGNERKRMTKAVERTTELTRDVLERLKGTVRDGICDFLSMCFSRIFPLRSWYQ